MREKQMSLFSSAIMCKWASEHLFYFSYSKREFYVPLGELQESFNLYAFLPNSQIKLALLFWRIQNI